MMDCVVSVHRMHCGLCCDCAVSTKPCPMQQDKTRQDIHAVCTVYGDIIGVSIACALHLDL